jgi:hypothetical protein
MNVKMIVTIYEMRALYWKREPPIDLPFIWGQGRTLRSALNDALGRMARTNALNRMIQTKRMAPTTP